MSIILLGTLKTVHESLKLGIPVLILEASGGCADVIAQALTTVKSISKSQDILNSEAAEKL